MSLAFLRRGPELNLNQHPFSQQAVYDDSRRGGIGVDLTRLLDEVRRMQQLAIRTRAPDSGKDPRLAREDRCAVCGSLKTRPAWVGNSPSHSAFSRGLG